MARNYIVYTWPFSEDNGGVIFMHRLVHELNRMGERALVTRAGPIVRLGPRGWLNWYLRRGPMRTDPALETPVARRSDITAESIIVYPELVPGNPLKARNVVRWLLYKPGLALPYAFGPDEMFFTVSSMSDLPEVTGGAPELFLWSVNRSYRNENRPGRDGVCYIVRKGSDKPRIPQTEVPGAICIDGMSHAQINDVFNRCRTFYSYDEATMYSQYAAIAGCTSVVIPGLYPSRAEWAASHELARYGVAYGLDDIPHAEATRHLVLGLLDAKEAKGRATVERFVALTHARFWDGAANRPVP